MTKMITKDPKKLFSFLLPCNLKSLQQWDWETFLNRLEQFKETHLGLTLQRCIKESIHLKETDKDVVVKTILQDFFKVCEEKNTSTFFEKEKKKSRELVEAVTLLVAVFLIVNCVGPLVSYIPKTQETLEKRHILAEKLCDEEHIPTLQEKKEKFWSHFFLGHPDDRVGENHSSVVSGAALLDFSLQLQIDGYMLSESIRGIPYLWSAVQMASVASTLCEDSLQKFYRFNLLADVAFLWQKSLENDSISPSPTLQLLSLHLPLKIALLANIFQNPSTDTPFFQSDVCKIQNAFMEMLQNVTAGTADDFFKELTREEHFVFLLNLSQRLTYFGKHELGYHILKNILAPFLGIKFQFSSCLGKRRQFQQEMVSQLVLHIEQHTKTDIQSMTISQEHESSVTNLKHTDIDPMSDLLPCIQTEQNESIYKNALDENQVLLLLNLCYHIDCKSPKGDTLGMEELQCVVERCLNPTVPSNGLVLSTCLWFRCHTEFHRYKTRDRAIHQLTLLNEDFLKHESQTFQNLIYSIIVPYPFRPSLAFYLGKRLMESGHVMCARDLFIELCMWEDAAECLIAANRQEMALDLLKERLAIRTSPRLLCCLGDVEKDPKYYEQAWQLSHQHYARAKRSLGFYFMSKQLLKEATIHFNEALEINPLFPETWFSLGCCYMKLVELDNALAAFSRVVQLQPENGEAWANAAAVHCQKGHHWNEAFRCIREAVRYHRNNWRMWDTYIKVSVKLENIEHCILGAKSMFESGHKQHVENWVYVFLAHQTTLLVQTLHQVPVNDPSRSTLFRELQRVIEFFESVEQFYVSDNVTFYMCHACIYTALQDASKEFPLRLKEFRAILNQLPQSFSNALQTTVDNLCKALCHLRLGYQRWYTTVTDVPHDNKKLKAKELLKLVNNLIETSTGNVPSNCVLLQDLDKTVEFFKQFT